LEELLRCDGRWMEGDSGEAPGTQPDRNEPPRL